jgi:spermidine synthase / saccharopine dehydrogenase (NADP+, L-glutamate-forming)
MAMFTYAPQIKHFYSYCGGLPAPEAANNPLGYKFSWSPRGVLLALLNSASYLSNHASYTVPGAQLMHSAAPYYISPAFAFVAYPNRDSTPFAEYYGIGEAETVLRGTLRYQGFPQMVEALVKMGWMDQGKKDWLNEGMTWADITQRAVEARDAKEA